ncbi:MAG: class I SAM-dependent methyltransferase [Proteobacteria bacterium]|nr:class I SAM-dependent methyltransferase [Pseudomonadota bacterium]
MGQAVLVLPADLPDVADPDFDRTLAEVLAEQADEATETPHARIWRRLSERLGEIVPTADYKGLRDHVASARKPSFWAAFPPQGTLSDVERAGLLRLALATPGEGDEAKMHALMEVARHAPQGDIVEIGSGAGRSASLLLPLAQRYHLGAILCIDPWAGGAAGDETLRVFEINLAAFAQGRLNYVRAGADWFGPDYGPGLAVTTEAFGTTAYEGAIAILHLDGPPAEAERDAKMWSPLVVGGGWIVFGRLDAGTRGAAEAFADANAGRIAARFEAGGSLFLQLKRHAGA